VDWKNLRLSKAPFIPKLTSKTDTKYFDSFPEQEPFYPPEKSKKKERSDTNFINYSYKRNCMDNAFLHALETLEAIKLSNQNIDEKNKVISQDKHEDMLEEGKYRRSLLLNTEKKTVSSIDSNSVVAFHSTKSSNVKNINFHNEIADNKEENSSNLVLAKESKFVPKNLNKFINDPKTPIEKSNSIKNDMASTMFSKKVDPKINNINTNGINKTKTFLDTKIPNSTKNKNE